MSEEIKVKISQPMFEIGELERFDNYIDDIVKEYSKLMFKEKDQILTQRIIMKQEEEIERLKNINEEYRILNGELRKELEVEKDISDGMLKTIDKAIEQCKQDKVDIWKDEGAYMEYFDELIDILKGSDKECLNCGEEKD